MRQNMVNFTIAIIFKGISETQKSTQNRKKFAQLRQGKIRRSSVYHRLVNYNTALREIYGLLSFALGTLNIADAPKKHIHP
jgi:hypothetical protein